MICNQVSCTQLENIGKADCERNDLVSKHNNHNNHNNHNLNAIIQNSLFIERVLFGNELTYFQLVLTKFIVQIRKRGLVRVLTVNAISILY